MPGAQFKLDMFEGPLDLLLHLISKHKLNIHDIQISLLLEQYLEYIHQLEHEDLEDAADFLEMAARLIYIKTVSLLPHDEEAQELKKELEGRLIEYSQCKYLAGVLAKVYAGGDIFVRKPAVIPVDKTYTREHEPMILLEAYLGLSEKARSEKPINAKIFQPIVSHKIVSIGTKIVYILKKLYTCGVCDLSHIYDGIDSKSERVATFLAILELTKSGRIVLNDDNTQISFSDSSRSRKKRSDTQESEQTEPQSEDTQEQAVSELLNEVVDKPFEVETDDVPEFKPEGSVDAAPVAVRAEAADDTPRGVVKQATERAFEPKPVVLTAPPVEVAEAEAEVEVTEQAVESVEVEETELSEEIVEPAVEVEDTEQAEEIAEPAVEVEDTEQVVEIEEPAADVEETELAEEIVEPAAEVEVAEQAVEIAETEVEAIEQMEDSVEIAAEVEVTDDNWSGVPFKPSYWGCLRYYWGNVPIGDDARCNCWRYGRAQV